MPEISKEEFARVRDLMAERIAKASPIIRDELVPYWQESKVFLAALEIAASASSPEPEPETDDWFPMETAPKVGAFLVFWTGGRSGEDAIKLMRRKQGSGSVITIVDGYFAFDIGGKAEKWRPLPAPPPSSRHSDGERR